MIEAIIGNLDYVISGIIGIFLMIGIVISPKRRPTDPEIIKDLREKLRRQGGMTISAQADSASLSAALDAQAKKHQREIHLLEERHKREMEDLRRKHQPIKMS